MIVYEKNNKLNINFENELDNPDIEIGKNEIKLGDSEISQNSLCPPPTIEDRGKVVTVQEDGTYGLNNLSGGDSIFIVNEMREGKQSFLDKTYEEIINAYNQKKLVVLRFTFVNGFSLLSWAGYIDNTQLYLVQFGYSDENNYHSYSIDGVLEKS